MADEVVETLKLIWEEVKALNGRIDRTREELSSRLDQTNQRLDAVRTELKAEMTELREEFSVRMRATSENEMRLATEIVEFTRLVRSMKEAFIEIQRSKRGSAGWRTEWTMWREEQADSSW